MFCSALLCCIAVRCSALHCTYTVQYSALQCTYPTFTYLTSFMCSIQRCVTVGPPCHGVHARRPCHAHPDQAMVQVIMILCHSAILMSCHGIMATSHMMVVISWCQSVMMTYYHDGRIIVTSSRCHFKSSQPISIWLFPPTCDQQV